MVQLKAAKAPKSASSPSYAGRRNVSCSSRVQGGGPRLGSGSAVGTRRAGSVRADSVAVVSPEPQAAKSAAAARTPESVALKRSCLMSLGLIGRPVALAVACRDFVCGHGRSWARPDSHRTRRSRGRAARRRRVRPPWWGCSAAAALCAMAGGPEHRGARAEAFRGHTAAGQAAAFASKLDRNRHRHVRTPLRPGGARCGAYARCQSTPRVPTLGRARPAPAAL